MKVLTRHLFCRSPSLAVLSTSSSTLVISLGSGASSEDMVTDDSSAPDDVELLPPCSFVGLDHHTPTILAGRVEGSQHILQITKTGVVLIDGSSGIRVDEWNSPSEITVAAFDGRQTVAVGARGGALSSLLLEGGKVVLQKSVTVPIRPRLFCDSR